MPRTRSRISTTWPRLFADVADGLQHAHSKGVVHRDIKPSNLILDGDGKLRILDFGLARLEGQESLTLSGDLMGTVLYMSPEQAMAKRIPLDHRTDVYSLGATIYEVLTGQPPLKGKDQQDTLSQIIVRDPRAPRQLNLRVPKDLETIVLMCLRKDPADRYGTAEALAQDLRRFARGDTVEARPERGWERFVRRAARHKWRLLATLCALVVLLGSGFVTYRLFVELQGRADEQYEKDVTGAVLKLLRGQTTLAPADGGLRRVTAWTLPGGWGIQTRATNVVEAAVSELEEAASRRPERFEAHYYLARGLGLLGRDEEAVTALEEALLRNPHFVPAHELKKDLGTEHEEALVPEVKVKWGGAWIDARQALRKRRWKEAVRAYDALLSLERQEDRELYLGSSIEHRLGRGVAHLELKMFAAAQQDFVIAGVFSPDALEPALLLGKAYYLDGKTRDAEDHFEQLVRRYQPADEARLWIGAVYKSLACG